MVFLIALICGQGVTGGAIRANYVGKVGCAGCGENFVIEKSDKVNSQKDTNTSIQKRGRVGRTKGKSTVYVNCSEIK